MGIAAKFKKAVVMIGLGALLATGGVVIQETAVPSGDAQAYSTWWAKNSMCINNRIRHTWYQVIDYDWYEETFYGKIDYNYPHLYYPHHYEYTNIYCTKA